MYEAYFQLQKRPFVTTPDAGCFYAYDQLQEALDELLLRAAAGQGIGVLTAAPGTGKSLLCRRLALELGEQFTPVYLANANYSTRRALLQALMFELGRKYMGLDEQELRLELIAGLRELVRQRRACVVVVDEAHLLNDRLLEEIRSLATYAEGEQPILRVVLVGSPALEERLTSRALEALNQRIACQICLDPLTHGESRDYVAYRLRWAGGDPARIMSPEALDLVAQVCNGLPRCINQLCDHSLILAYVQNRRQVSAEVVRDALADLKQLPLQWNAPLAATMPATADLPESVISNHSTRDEHIAAPIMNLPASDGPTTTIEIGGDCEASGFADYETAHAARSAAAAQMADEDAEPVLAPARMVDARGGGVVPLPGAVASAVRVFQEEPVFDRYAQLDGRMPKIVRTFDDATSLPRPRLMDEPIPAPPQPAPVDAAPEMRQPVASTAGDVVDDLEEQIGADVLDVCLDVQNAIEQRRETSRQADWHSSSTMDDQPEEASSTRDFDVVEPEPERRTPTRPAPIVSESTSNTEPSERAPVTRHVPQPNYRLVFSTLRKKLGRSIRRER